MYAKFAALLTCAVLTVGAAGCGTSETLKEHRAFCKARINLDKVEQVGTVGDFGPALMAFTSRLPQSAPDDIRATASSLTSSWDKLYATYVTNGGDPKVHLEVDNQVPPEIAGLRAEWTTGLNRTKVRALYSFADEECG